jgi:hypothetical protein
MSNGSADENLNNENLTDENLTKMQERNEQTLTDIQNLQSIEKDLYNNLEKDSASGLLTPEKKDKLINKINEISQMRINLYSNLRNNYSFYQENVIDSRYTLDEQTAAINIVENELNEAKQRLKMLEDEKYNKLRYVEINTYYGKQYNDHTSVMKIIIFICVPILILSILANKGLIPSNIYGALLGIILIIGVIVLGSKLIQMANRDNMNYDQFNWYFNKNDADTTSTTEDTSGTDPWETSTSECVGALCCTDGTYFDASLNICVIGTAPVTTDTTTTDTTTTDTTTDTTTV